MIIVAYSIILFIIMNSCIQNIESARSQKSIFFFKKDTLFITYNTSQASNIIIKEYDTFTRPNNISYIIRYNLMDSLEINRKEKLKKYLKSNPGIGINGTEPIFFGLHFSYGKSIKDKNKRRRNFKHLKNDIFYNFAINSRLKKDKITFKDSLNFDWYVFKNVYYRYKYKSILCFSKNELIKKKVIHFDGSEKRYNEIKKISKEPVYIFILDRIKTKKLKNGELKKCYVFNEVTLMPKPIVR